MNPSTTDEEIEDEVKREVLEEPIERHPKQNDSYRESPITDDNEIIVQPPLDPITDYEESEPLPTLRVPEETFQETPRTSSIEVTHEPDSDIPFPTQSGTDDSATIVDPEEIFRNDVTTDNFSNNNSTAEKAVYHTVSGGPETIIGKFSKNAPAPIPFTADQIISGKTFNPTASGYSVPQPLIETQIQQSESSMGGLIFLLCVILLLGAPTLYLYFFQPAIFDQALSALIVVKNQLLKN